MIKKILIIIIGGLISCSLTYPLLTRIFLFPLPAQLNGAFAIEPKPVLTLSSCIKGSFQSGYVKYKENSFPFKSWFVRLNNQLDFSLFGELHARQTVLGKNGFLFEDTYISSYLGMDFIGEKAVSNKIRRLAMIQKELARNNVDFILVFAPNKARFMPENIPDSYLKTAKKESNYDAFIRILNKKETGINFIDFNKYFSQIKDTSRFPLYPKGGTHWSIYSALSIVSDSLRRYMAALSGKRIAGITNSYIEWSDTLRNPDDDIARGLNLIFPYPGPPMAYPRFADGKEKGLWKPDLLVIADSYYWIIFSSSVLKNSFNREDFWYYNKSYYPAKRYSKIEKSPELLLNDMLHHDFVVLMVTEINLPTMFDFPEHTLALLDSGNVEIRNIIREKEKRVLFYMAMIRNSQEWYKSIVAKAREGNKTIEQAIRDDAEYMADKETK